MSRRIAYLDGHRGLAIVSVVLFHAYARWPDLVPYGDQYKPLFKFGWLGVQLFFLISGFVIFMTLEKCFSVREFLFRRWLRLFPAMLVCSLLIFFSGSLFQERPFGPPTIAGMLPGLLFIEPSWFKHAFDLHVMPIEGVFWSLYVEFKFYVIASLLYFRIGRARLISLLFALNAFAFLVHALVQHYPGTITISLDKIAYALSLEHFGWFAAGASAYCFVRTNDNRWFVASIALATYSAVVLRLGDVPNTVAALLVAAFFLASLVIDLLKKLLENQAIQFLGFISYPLYLLHENIMVASIIKLDRVGAAVPQISYPLVPLVGLCWLSYFVAKYIEPHIKDILAKRLMAEHGHSMNRPGN